MQLGFEFGGPRRTEEAGDAQVVPPAEPVIYSVSSLTRRVREVIEGDVGEVWVEGEVSNLRRQASGHQYFTLKDDGSQLPCVLFAGAARLMRNPSAVGLVDGAQVQAFGEMTVYEARGQYQLVVRLVQPCGQGALRAKFEALKAKLAAEGLFDPARKRALPRFPRRIGVVTSPTGAAIRDFLKVVTRRMPGVEVIINPVRVQGRGAAGEIVAAVREFSDAPGNGLPEVDVMVLIRGGGSIEDLWEFNEEVVARALVACRIPTVCGVGHEIDFTIADFAADVRAPTPSAAAEILAPDAEELLLRLAQWRSRIGRTCVESLRFFDTRLSAVRRSALFREPERIVRERRQAVDGLAANMLARIEGPVREARQRTERAQSALRVKHPGQLVALLRERSARQAERLTAAPAGRLAEASAMLAARASLLQALSPAATLSRGFTITQTRDGKIVRSAGDIGTGNEIETRFTDGRVRSVVTGAERESGGDRAGSGATP
jgi:exodeoxyribonuclease VII large subunit